MISEGTTLVAFALLMLVMGFKMWSDSVGNSEKNGTCVRDIGGELRWSSPCAVILVIAGFSVGVLSGVFGVGGGVLIVPALVFIAKMPVHRAVATSLLVIALTCLSGALSYLWLGDGIPLPVTLYFIGGGLLGMLIGGNLEAKFSSSIMRRVFALAMWGIAIFVLVDNLLPGRR
jgi:uncharacterized membrane protein YfcA